MNEKLIKKIYDTYDETSLDFDKALKHGYLTVNKGRNNHTYVWYYDGQSEWCYDLNTKKLVNDKTIEQQLL